MLHPELPQNIEAERATLGSMLMNRDAIVLVASWLTPQMFYLERHGQLYAAIHSLYSRHIPPDLRTVMDELKRRGQMDAIGGLEYLTGLTGGVPTSYHVEYYAREVERCAVLRGLVNVGSAIAKIGYDDSQEVETAIGSAQQALANVTGRAGRPGLIPLSELIDREYQRLDRAASEEGYTVGVKTGFVDFDSLTGGLQDQDLILLAARPSTGKSALMACLARGVSATGGRDALIFSLEMSADQLTQRMVAMASRVDSSRIRSLHFSDHDSEAFLATLPEVAAYQIAIDDTPAVSVAYVRNAAYRHQAAHERQIVIFVDYLQLMTAAGEHLDNRVQAVSSISRDLKALAKELCCPVVALSQLSRAVEGRPSKIPLLSDLRESGSLEQDADIVLMLHREEMYDRDTDKKGVAELYIAKNRNGPLGVVPLRFDAMTTRFDNLSNPFGGPAWQP